MPSTRVTSKWHHVLFLFDPACPWAWRASLWIRAVSQVRRVEMQWGLLSLEFLNRENEDNPFHELHVKSRLPLRLLSMAHQVAGNGGIDSLYLTLGNLHHAQGLDLDSEVVLSEALSQAKLPSTLLEEARISETLDEALRSDYERAWVSGAFGVPTIYIDHSEVPYFGPVIDSVPPLDKAGELWDLILGISTHPYFYELKRDRM